MTFAAWFAIVVGVGMIGQWTASYVTKQIPELQSEPLRIAFHLVGEMSTALCLIVAGIGLLTATTWASVLFLIAMGMLFYTMIVSPGYFAQQGKWAWVLLFGILLVLGIVAVMSLLSSGA